MSGRAFGFLSESMLLFRYRLPHKVNSAGRNARNTATLATIPSDMTAPMLNTPR